MSSCELDPLVTGLVVPLGPLMQGILETPGLTVAGNLEHGRVKVVPNKSRTFLILAKYQYMYNATAKGRKIEKAARERKFPIIIIWHCVCIRWECNCLCVKVEQIVHLQMKMN